MKYLLILILLIPLFADERPKIGLVLSGGGARGGAHLGALQVLEANKIPIDAIVGTSMGAFVGGFYAAGYSTDEIGHILKDTEWTKYIAFEYDRTEIPFRRKALMRDFPGSLKVGIDTHDEITLSSGLFKRQPMLDFLDSKLYDVSMIEDFDDLTIPFRAVATDFETGESVSLGTGSLVRSIYASLSIPGGFYPIEIDGRILVDGGVADNLPLDVMRDEMDVDVIIVIDVSMPFEKLPKYQSFLTIVDQLSNILVRKNTDITLSDLYDNELLVIPELDGISPLDTKEYRKIIGSGTYAMKVFGEHYFDELSLDEEAYAHYRKSLRHTTIPNDPLIDQIILHNPTYLDDDVILKRLHIRAGEHLDHHQLQVDIRTIYDLMLFDDVLYDIKKIDGTQELHITVVPSADVRGEIKFAFGFEDDFNGHSDYSVKLEYLMRGLNSLGGEWRNRFEIGIQKLLYTELYQPLDPLQRSYLRPALFYRDKKVYVSPTLIGNHLIEADLDDSLPVQVKEYGGEVALGVNIGDAVQIEGGIASKEVNPGIKFLERDAFGFVQGDVSSLQFIDVSSKQSLTEAFAYLRADTMDETFFPSRGTYLDIGYHRQLPEWGSEMRYSQLRADLTGVKSIGRHTLIGDLKGGTTFSADDLTKSEDFDAFYTLGGLFDLSGLPTNAITGDKMLFGALGYRYRISEKGFFGALEMPLYAGLTLEGGDAWYSQYGDKMDIIAATSAYLAADTVLGPLYLGIGMADNRYYNLYLSLGRSF